MRGGIDLEPTWARLQRTVDVQAGMASCRSCGLSVRGIQVCLGSVAAITYQGEITGLCIPSKEFGGINVQNLCELFQHVSCCGVLLPLKHADIVSVDVGPVSKFLLREASGLPQTT